LAKLFVFNNVVYFLVFFLEGGVKADVPGISGLDRHSKRVVYKSKKSGGKERKKREKNESPA
jgi:hypothetical protein